MQVWFGTTSFPENTVVQLCMQDLYDLYVFVQLSIYNRLIFVFLFSPGVNTSVQEGDLETSKLHWICSFIDAFI